MSKTATKKRNKTAGTPNPRLPAPWENDDDVYSEALDILCLEIENAKNLEEAVTIAYIYTRTMENDIAKQLITALNTKRQRIVMNSMVTEHKII